MSYFSQSNPLNNNNNNNNNTNLPVNPVIPGYPVNSIVPMTQSNRSAGWHANQHTIIMGNFNRILADVVDFEAGLITKPPEVSAQGRHFFETKYHDIAALWAQLLPRYNDAWRHWRLRSLAAPGGYAAPVPQQQAAPAYQQAAPVYQPTPAQIQQGNLQSAPAQLSAPAQQLAAPVPYSVAVLQPPLAPAQPPTAPAQQPHLTPGMALSRYTSPAAVQGGTDALRSVALRPAQTTQHAAPQPISTPQPARTPQEAAQALGSYQGLMHLGEQRGQWRASNFKETDVVSSRPVDQGWRQRGRFDG